MRLRSLFVASACTLPLTVAGQQTTPAESHRSTPAYDSYLTGNPDDVTRKTTGGLQLEGGGTDIPDAFRWLIDHAGGGDVVVIRASGSDGYNPWIPTLGDVDSVESIVFHSREAASDPDVLKSLEHAEAVFLAGGDQSNYIKYWKGTPVETTIEALAKRGVPIGGTSAGLAVLARFGFSAMNDSIASAAALANPYDEKITIERDFLSLPHLDGIITDSHFAVRDRMGRSLAFLARIVADGWASPARSIAVDQESAVLVEPDGSAHVVGKTATYFMRTTQAPTVCRPNTPLSIDGIDVYRVPPGGTFNLTTWTGTGGTAYTLSVHDGVIQSSTGQIYSSAPTFF